MPPREGMTSNVAQPSISRGQTGFPEREALNSQPMDLDSGAEAPPNRNEPTPEGARPFREPHRDRPTSNRTPPDAVPFGRTAPGPADPTLQPLPPRQGPNQRNQGPPKGARSYGNPEGIAQHVADVVLNTQVPLTVKDLSTMSPQVRSKLRDISNPSTTRNFSEGM